MRFKILFIIFLLYAFPAEAQFSGRPRIYSRAQWRADETLLYRSSTIGPAPRTSTTDESRSDASPRVADCKGTVARYPKEFRVLRTIKEENGELLRWPRRYSPQVRQIVVHHTAQNLKGKRRSGVDSMRALYKYHAVDRGWGDIGYHYVIDGGGRIYEGRSGGKSVVGAHAYCHNVGTVSVAMMGNFDIDKSTQRQVASLQWLIADLAKTYNIRPGATITVKGKRMPTIVGHGDLLSTECPGYFVRNALGQIRQNVASNRLAQPLTFPRVTQRRPKSGIDKHLSSRLGLQTIISKRTGLTALGSTELTGRPGGQLNISMRYTAGSTMDRRSRIADIKRSSKRVGIEQELNGRYITVRDELLLPKALQNNQSLVIRLRITLPRDADLYTLDIGNDTYTLHAEGRRSRSVIAKPSLQRFSRNQRTNTQTPGYRRVLRNSTPRSSQTLRRRLILDDGTKGGRNIRILLSHTAEEIVVESSTFPDINGVPSKRRTVRLRKDGRRCRANQDGNTVSSGIVRIDPNGGMNTVASWRKTTNVFRGIIECRVVDDKLILINELPIEHYMAGLAEEPDTELWEKQRAFAIAARSYAAFYTNSANRKFPGKPYDGSDSPASFQMYGGYVFEMANPRWVEVIENTAHLVLKKRGSIIKAAYFSTDDGRTRAPGEKGWKNFPFAEVFRSKPDPWCNGLPNWGHGVGMSGCGAGGQAREGKVAEEILGYYYPGTSIEVLK